MSRRYYARDIANFLYNEQIFLWFAFKLDCFNEEEKTKFHFDSTEFYKDKDDADDIQLLYDSYNKLEKNSVVQCSINAVVELKLFRIRKLV